MKSLRNEIKVVQAEPMSEPISETEPGFIRSLESLPEAQQNQVKYRLEIVKF